MNFIQIIMMLIGYFVTGVAVTGFILFLVNRWQPRRGMAYRDSWQNKVRYQVRRFLLY